MAHAMQDIEHSLAGNPLNRRSFTIAQKILVCQPPTNTRENSVLIDLSTHPLSARYNSATPWLHIEWTRMPDRSDSDARAHTSRNRGERAGRRDCSTHPIRNKTGVEIRHQQQRRAPTQIAPADSRYGTFNYRHLAMRLCHGARNRFVYRDGAESQRDNGPFLCWWFQMMVSSSPLRLNLSR